MSFYGKIVNYVTNAFKSIQSDEIDKDNKNISVEPSSGSSIKFTGDGTINSKVDKNGDEIVVQYAHNSVPENATITKVTTTSTDETGAITTSFGIKLPIMDKYGHLNIAEKDSAGNVVLNQIYLLFFKDDGKGNISIKGG